MTGALAQIPMFSTMVVKANDAYHWLVPTKKAPPSIVERVRLAVMSVWQATCRTFYVGVDALDRIRESTDGLDKVLKLCTSISVGAMLFSCTDKKYFKWLSKELKYIDSVFSAISVFGRWSALTEMQFDAKTGKYQRVMFKDGPIKEASVVLMAISKLFEFGRFMQTIGFLSTQWLIAADAQYLGGIAAQVGSSNVIGRAAFEVGLGGCKNFFLILSSSYSILNNTITVIDGKMNCEKSLLVVKRAALSIGADAGKIYLASAAFAVAPLWVAVAFLTAVFSLSKILLDSYGNGRVEFPAWMTKA